MNPQLTPKDWENLSTYLDGQLTGSEKRLVMDQLALRPELAQGLEELRRTRAVLRAAPRRRAPRNFTLTPAMVPQKRRLFSWGWAPSLGFASALATILLVLSFFFRFAPAGLPAASAPAPLTAQQGTTASEGYPPVIVWNGNTGQSPAFGLGGGTGPANSADTFAQPTPAPDRAAPAPATAPTQVANAAGKGPDATSAPAQAATTAEKAPGATPESTAGNKAFAPQAALQATAAPGRAGISDGPILGVAPAEEQGKMIVPTQARALEYAADHQTAGSSWPWVQVALGAAALLSGLAAFWLWRRSRV